VTGRPVAAVAVAWAARRSSWAALSQAYVRVRPHV
jgi:hypothetical protein